MDLIRIDGLELRCIVGLRSYERHREQPIRLDIALGLDLSSPGRSGRIADSADYARVADEITALLRFREYRLLEVAAEECAALLFASHPPIQQVRLRLDKPEALAGRARSAAVEITRTRGAFGSTLRPAPHGGRVELLRESEAVIELLHVEPGHEVEFCDDARRLEFVTSPERQGHDTRPIEYSAGQRSEYRATDQGLWICRCVATGEPPPTKA